MTLIPYLTDYRSKVIKVKVKSMNPAMQAIFLRRTVVLLRVGMFVSWSADQAICRLLNCGKMIFALVYRISQTWYTIERCRIPW